MSKDDKLREDPLPEGYDMRGLLTGLPLPVHKGRGRPKIYINALARKVHHQLLEADRNLAKLAEETGFTPASERMMRQRIFQIANSLNRNKLRKRKRNPREETHACLLYLPNGDVVTVCHYNPPTRRVRTGSGDLNVTDVHVTECADLVTCPDCIAAGNVPELR